MQIQVQTPIPRFGASRSKECPLFNSAGAYSGGRLRQVGADSLSQTVYRNDFLILVPTLGIGVGTRICLHYKRTLLRLRCVKLINRVYNKQTLVYMSHILEKEVSVYRQYSFSLVVRERYCWIAN